MANQKLQDWGLPECIRNNYTAVGLTDMFAWQAECLSLPGVLDGKNLIVSAPTSAGKTLIVEILMAKRVYGTGKKALLVFPFVSLAREKMFHLRNIFDGTGLNVDGYMGGMSPPGGFSSVDIAVCTIEKANSILNKLIEEKSTEQLGMVVVDELHMVGDDGRGYLLELLLTKIRYLKTKEISIKTPPCQIIGLSATVTNLGLFATWLDGLVYETKFRPVPLSRYVKIGKEIFDEKLIKCRDFQPQVTFNEDDDDITALCYETICNNHSVLLFCPTKKWCENLANLIARNFQQINGTKIATAGRAGILEQLRRSPAGLDPLLHATIPIGVAYHHAGLTTEERDILESGFRQSYILVLVATSTLSSGVNLPARRVIIRTPIFHRALIDLRVYQQMTGRAGRKGESDTGESILICRTNERNQAKLLTLSDIPPVKSCLVGKLQNKSTVRMERAVLEVIGSGLVSNIHEVMVYIQCSFLHAQLSSETTSSQRRRRSSNHELKLLDDIVHTCVEWLVNNEFIYLQQCEEKGQSMSKKVMATQFGRASLYSSLPTDQSLQVLADLQVASRAFALDSELHLIYQITPLNVLNDWLFIDWSQYLSIYENLNGPHQRVAVLVGVEEGLLTRLASGGARGARFSTKLQQKITIHKRFYAALILQDILQEVPFTSICDKYDCNRGVIQALQQSAASFAGMVTSFCHELAWWCMELLFNEFQSRLLFGVQRELLDLTRIPLLNNKRARGLYLAGFTSCKLVAEANSSEVENILRNIHKFQSKKHLYGDNAWEVEERKKLHVIKIIGSTEGLTEAEAAVAIIAHAKVLSDAEGIGTYLSKSRLSTQTAHKATQPVNQTTQHVNHSTTNHFSQSINFPSNQAVNQTINQPVNQTTPNASHSTTGQFSQSITLPPNQPVNQSFNQPVNQSYNPSVNQTTPNSSHSTTGAFSQSINLPPNLCVNHSYNQSVNQSFNPSANQSYNSSVNQSFNLVLTPHTHDSQKLSDQSKVSNISISNVFSNYCATIEDSRVAHEISRELSVSLCENNETHVVTKHSTPYVSRMSLDLFQTSFNDSVDQQKASPDMQVRKPKIPSWYTNIELKPGEKYKVFNIDHEKLSDFFHIWANETKFAFSVNVQTCTSEKDPKLVGLSLCWSPTVVYYLDIQILKTRHPSVIEDIQNIFESFDEDVIQIAFCIKDQFKWMLNSGVHGVTTSNNWQDPMIASWMMDPDNIKQGLFSLVEHYCSEHLYLFQDTKYDWDVNRPSYTSVSSEKVCCVESIASYILMLQLEEQLSGMNMWQHFTGVEMPHMYCVALLELNGIEVDNSLLKRYRLELHSASLALQEKAWKILGRKFNLSNPKEVSKVLFQELRLAPNDNKKPGLHLRKLAHTSTKFSRTCSTNKEVLQSLCDQPNPHPLPHVIMSWRTVNYALNKVILLINSLPPSCGRLHHKCLTLTNTGRMIMSEPNIQSIPKQFSITKGNKSEADSEQSFCLRNIFVAGNGKLLISADYSQIELRILAHLSGDETLIAAFNSSGVDIFKSIAAMFYSEISSIDDVTDKQRDTTKQTCYGILYGMGAQTLAQQMNTSETDAQNAMDSFMNSYPMVKVYFNRLVAQCKEKGYIETISGRRRYLPEIKSVRLKMRSHAERQAVNSTIQGSAADIVKMATYKIHCAVASLGWNTLHQNTRSNTTDFFLVHHIHDELIYEVAEKKLHEAVSIIERCMVDAFPMSVKLAVRIKVGKLWGDLNKYENFIPVL